jgi:hypothetical protein
VADRDLRELERAAVRGDLEALDRADRMATRAGRRGAARAAAYRRLTEILRKRVIILTMRWMYQTSSGPPSFRPGHVRAPDGVTVLTTVWDCALCGAEFQGHSPVEHLCACMGENGSAVLHHKEA